MCNFDQNLSYWIDNAIIRRNFRLGKITPTAVIFFGPNSRYSNIIFLQFLLIILQ